MMTAVWAILIFLVLVFVHEFGHFAAAKLSGVTVLEFALGMGPALLKKKWHGTEYSLRLLPIGGYCKLEGEDQEEQSAPREGSINSKPPLLRFFVMVSGALMNLILGFVLFCILLSMTKAITVPVIQDILPNSPAQVAQLQPGDRIAAINGVRVHSQNELSFQLSRYAGAPIVVNYQRGDQKLTTTLTPMKEEDGRYIIGFHTTLQTLNAASILQHAYYQTVFMIRLTFTSFLDLITGRLGINQLSGPVGIVNEIGSAAKAGFDSLLFLAALITINLGVFNLLPLPALDGGRIIFVLLEVIFRKKVRPEKEGMVHVIGFLMLLGLMLFATWNDLTRLFFGKGV